MYNLIDKWLNDNDFDNLIYRLCLEHNNINYPNNKLKLLFNYLFDKYEYNIIFNDINNKSLKFNDYIFSIENNTKYLIKIKKTSEIILEV